MMLKKIRRRKIRTARMTGARHETHVLSHLAIGSFPLHSAAGIVRIPFPLFHAPRRSIDMSAQRALVVLFFFLEAVEMIRQERLGYFDVNRSLSVLHHFVRADMPRIHRRRSVVGIEAA